MQRSLSRILAAAFLAHAWVAGWAAPQAPKGQAEEDLKRLSELIDAPVVVASRSPRTLRESPGIVTVLRREEILATGARDLAGLLRLLPGFDFASDSQGVVGIGVRTAWAHDGKVLLLIDGQEMNEPFYATTQFGGHYPLDNVEKVEVVRGPGSAIYGGCAELAVISVTTRRGSQINGVSGSLLAGKAPGTLASREVSLAFGRAWGDTEVSLAYTGAASARGAGSWPLDPAPGGRSVQVGEAGRVQEDFLNLGFSQGAFDLRYLRDRHRLTDFTEEFQPGQPQIRFPSDLLELAYTLELGPAWTLRPRFAWKQQTPWSYVDLPEPVVGHPVDQRQSPAVHATWRPAAGFQLLLGASLDRDEATRSADHPFRDGRTRLTYENRAALAQATWSPAWGNLDVGARLDDHSQFGTSVSPRIAYTFATPAWHFKLLAAGAFRAPAIANLNVNPALRPERTTTYEVELGRALGAAVYLTGNLFFLRIHDPISYVNPAPGVDWYANFDHTGARGIELDLQARGAWGSLRSTLSLARALDHQAEFYRVDGDDAYHVGFADLKLASFARLELARGWSLDPSLVLLAPRYGYRLGETRASRFGSSALLDLWLTRRLAQLEFSAGATNLLDSDNPLIQAYGTPGQGGNPPIPGPRRELLLRCRWQF